MASEVELKFRTSGELHNVGISVNILRLMGCKDTVA
jgi:hypothetical protein